MITAEIKSLDLSSDVPWSDFLPDDPVYFGFYLTATIGVAGNDGGDLFQILICSPQWLSDANRRGECLSSRHFEIDQPFNTKAIEAALAGFVQSCRGENWQEVVDKLSQKAEWEFEGYGN